MILTKKAMEKRKITTLDTIIQKYFGDDKTVYFHSSDALAMIEGDTYLRYSRKRSDLQVEIYLGGDGGEVCLRVCSTPRELDALMMAIVYS